MNLFVVCWNGQPEDRLRAASALLAMHDTYTLLDRETQGTWSGTRGFVAWMHTNRDAAGPRRYVHHSDNELVLFDGIAVDATGKITAHDAGALATHWAELTDHLEGRFAAVRMDDRSETLEIINDPCGIHSTFVYNRGDTWWIANSVRLLARAAGLTTLDLEGLAMSVAVRWPGGNRTLVDGVSTLPAAQRWRWIGDAPPKRTAYWPISELARQPKRSFGKGDAATLADDMGGALRTLSEAFAPLQCPITAGRDSRMLTGLMMAQGLPGDFFTAGEPDEPDALHGTAIAERFGLSHRRSSRSTAERPEAWDEASHRVLQMHDGMVTLLHAKNALKTPERLDRIALHLYGLGGELGRGKRLETAFVVRRPEVKHAVAQVRSSYRRGIGLLRPEARQWVRDYFERTCRTLHEQGFAPVDIPDAFDLSEKGRRWGGSQARQVAEHKDVFMPFATRPYVRAALATPATERLVERIPFLLLNHLSPELLAMPGTSPWPPRSVAALALQEAASAPAALLERIMRRVRRRRPGPAAPGSRGSRLPLLERQAPRWRERYLDRSDLHLWQVIDRERFEYLTSGRATRAERTAQIVNLFQAATALAYEEDFAAWMGPPQ